MTVLDHGNEDDQRAPGLQEFTIQWGERLDIFTQIIINCCCDGGKGKPDGIFSLNPPPLQWATSVK